MILWVWVINVCVWGGGGISVREAFFVFVRMYVLYLVNKFPLICILSSVMLFFLFSKKPRNALVACELRGCRSDFRLPASSEK